MVIGFCWSPSDAQKSTSSQSWNMYFSATDSFFVQLKKQFAFRHRLNASKSHPSALCLGIADASALCLGDFIFFLASLIFRIPAALNHRGNQRTIHEFTDKITLGSHNSFKWCFMFFWGFSSLDLLKVYVTRYVLENPITPREISMSELLSLIFDTGGQLINSLESVKGERLKI